MLVSAGLFLIVFRVSIVDCTNCNEEQNKKVAKLANNNLFFTDFDKILNSDVKITKLKRQLPNKIIIEVEKQNELFNLIQKDGSSSIFDENGNLISENKTNSNLPNLILKTDLNLEIIPKLAMIFKKAFDLEIKIKEVEYNDKFNIIIYFADNLKIPKIIIDESTITSKLESVLILNKAKEINDLNSQILEVDARFDNPVLRIRQ